MAMFKSKWTWLCLFILLSGAGLLAWLEQVSIVAWYHAGRLARADESDRERHLQALAALEAAAVPALLNHLDSKDETRRANARWALIELARQWGPNDANTRLLAAYLEQEFENFNGIAQGEAMLILSELMEQSEKNGVNREYARLAGRFLSQASEEESALPGVLQLAWSSLRQANPPGDLLLHACRRCSAAGLADRRADCRVLAVRLAAAPLVGLVDQLPPLLKDADAEVRGLALLAVGGLEDLVSTDELLPLLHDSDSEVRGICMQALRSRGLVPAQLQLAKAMGDPQPSVRARVPAQIDDFPELDTRVWLERLSRDSSPAVRAAAVRVAGERRDLAERLKEIVLDDPSPTVRQIADYYLRR
jgi:hypothetical protein